MIFFSFLSHFDKFFPDIMDFFTFHSKGTSSSFEMFTHLSFYVSFSFLAFPLFFIHLGLVFLFILLFTNVAMILEFVDVFSEL